MKNKNGTLIRTAKIEDAEEILLLAKKVMGEVEFFEKDSKEFNSTVEDEEKFLEKTTLVLVAEINGKIVGVSTLQRGNANRTSHIGTFGITILKQYSGMKIGTSLMNEVLKWSKENNIEKIELEVFNDNIPAIGLYKKFGFIIEGVKNKKIKIRDKYKDVLILGKFLE